MGLMNLPHEHNGMNQLKINTIVTLGYTLRILLEIILGFKLPVGDVNGPS